MAFPSQPRAAGDLTNEERNNLADLNEARQDWMQDAFSPKLAAWAAEALRAGNRAKYEDQDGRPARVASQLTNGLGHGSVARVSVVTSS